MRTRLFLLSVGILLDPWSASAQVPPQLPRADVAIVTGWIHSDVGTLDEPGDDWTHAQATLAAQGGFYWTEHIKTELTIERSTDVRTWVYEPIPIGGGVVYRTGQHRIGYTRLSLGQFYQFGHNAFAHVSLGGGVSVRRREVLSEFEPLAVFDRFGRRVIQPGRSSTRDVETSARPFLAAAFKGYFNERVFFRSDLHADFRSTLDHVIVRAGVGVDF